MTFAQPAGASMPAAGRKFHWVWRQPPRTPLRPGSFGEKAAWATTFGTA